jgi:hypothetical protein
MSNPYQPLPFEEVRRRFESKGLTLPEQEYRNIRTPLRYVCQCRREGTIQPRSLYTKQGPCRHCVHDARRPSLEQIRKVFADQGCDFLGERYENVHTPVPFRCSCGNHSFITLQQFKRGSRCSNCTARRQRLSTHPLERVKQQFAKEGCELLAQDYINDTQPLLFRCSCGRQAYVTRARFRKGARCPDCASVRQSGERNLSEDTR